MDGLAKEVYNLIAPLPPREAQIVAGMIVAAGVHHDLRGYDIEKMYVEHISKSMSDTKNALVRSYVSKRETGEDVESIVQITRVIAKLDRRFKNEPRQAMVAYLPKHSVNMAQVREAARSPRPLPPGPAMRGTLRLTRIASLAKADKPEKEKIGVRSQKDPHPGPETAQQRHDAQEGQNRDESGRYASGGSKKQRALYQSAKLPYPGKAFGTAKRPNSTLDTVAALSANQRRYLSADALGASGQGTPRPDRFAFVPEIQNLRRVQAGTDFLQATVGGYMPPSAQVALGASSFVARYGQEAPKVFGSTLDRAKYRYKGVERKVDPELRRAMHADLNTKEKGPVKREKLLYGHLNREITGRPHRLLTGAKLGVTEAKVEPSATVAYFREHLPNSKLAALQRAAGHQPPSEGIILDPHGQVSTQMVGHGDDWYLPFNLKNLGPLKGGDYIRTRTNGGLSTEDVYTGLMAGARGMAVVSHDGTFVMEFDDTLRGTRRYSESARQMTDRYGQLLDAVKNGKVHYEPIDPTRQEELAEQATTGGYFDRGVFQQLLQEERADPHPSRAQVRSWGMDYVEEFAADHGYEGERDESGRTMSTPGQQFIEQELVPIVNEELRGRDGMTDIDPALYDERARAEIYNNPGVGMMLLGGSEARKFDKYVGERTEEYIDTQQPMQLNGRGYEFAMHALQEQFPYYVKSVHWEPWPTSDQRESPLERNKYSRTGAIDYGYVMPRYNRSKDIEEGYFEQDILGYPKVPASYTRYQNWRVTPTIETTYMPPGTSDWRKERLKAAQRPESLPGKEGKEGEERKEEKKEQPKLPKAITPEAKTAQYVADKAYVNAVLSAKTFSPNWTHPEFTEDFIRRTRNTEMEDHKSSWFDKHGYGVLNKMPGDYDALSPDELRKVAQQIADLNKRDHIVDVPKDIQAKFDAEGGEPPLTKAKDIELERVDPETDEIFDFGPAFADGHSRSQYSMVYGSDPLIAGFRARTHTKINDPELPANAALYIADNQNELEDAIDAKDDAKYVHHANAILGALMAKQLHRFYHRASGTVGGTKQIITEAETQKIPHSPQGALNRIYSAQEYTPSGLQGRFVPLMTHVSPSPN